ncbi:MAG: glycoside hydrolase family 15 protein [Hyphomicrobiaceae bacterium]|nr:glycoside hydrolase family 15 protein [Hyphomicrobiaceae bacterium]
MAGLDLGIIGNCAIGALIDREARLVWCCLPRFDGDPVFNALLRPSDGPSDDPNDGAFAITLAGMQKSEQYYETNSAVLKTILHGPSGSIEISDCIPRFPSRGRLFRPQTIVRRVRPLSGRPRIRVQLRPSFSYGAKKPVVTNGSNHVRYVGPDFTIRLTTNAPIDYILAETEFSLNEPVSFLLGPDETLSDGVGDTARHFEEQTLDYWRNWSRRLALPLDWQDAVIRAAITLKLCTYEPTGAIVAALTTSIPEAANSGRNWDYRFCWLRDAFFVVRALNSLGAVHTMENYFDWLSNIVERADNGHLQPVYGIGLEAALTERVETSLSGYRGMGPVRVGNQAHEHFQHDVYGNLILGAVQTFFDHRLTRKAGQDDFRRLEVAGEQAFRLHNQPDAGMWELRSRAHVHTSSSLMCWAACDRLAKIAQHLALSDRATYWRKRADTIRDVILAEAWSEKRQAFTDSFGGTNLDAGVLLMVEVGMIDPHDPRFISTVERLEETLARGPYMMRYESADDFGLPETAFNICAFWRLDALSRIGRREQAIEIFEALLASRNHLGLLSEDTDFSTGEMWGNFPQTYSMVGIINGAMRLSRPWETSV